MIRPGDREPETPSYQVVVHPGFSQDAQRIYDASGGDPASPEYHVVLHAGDIARSLKFGRHSTHRLGFQPGYPDLSDCETSYVGSNADEKPSHRIVWREKPPSRPGGLPVRELIALGERSHGAVYHLAGSRLGRPTNISLEELKAAPEPIRRAPTAPTAQPKPQSNRQRFPELYTGDGVAGESYASPGAGLQH